MLRQGAPAPEFESADALRAHYRALRSRTWAPRAVRLRPDRTRSRTPSEALADRQQREAAERAAAILAERARLRELAAEVLTPEYLAKDPRHIISQVGAAFGFTYAEIVGPHQFRPLARARWAAIAAVRAVRPNMPMSRLGHVFNRDLTAIRYALVRMAERGVPQPPTVREPERIVADVAAAFGVTCADVAGPSTVPALVRARWAALAAVRSARPDLSLQGLGRLFGDRDHTTIRHALQKMAVEGVPQPAQGEPA